MYEEKAKNKVLILRSLIFFSPLSKSNFKKYNETKKKQKSQVNTIRPYC